MTGTWPAENSVQQGHSGVMVLSRFSSFLPQSKDKHISLIGESKLAIDLNVSA